MVRGAPRTREPRDSGCLSATAWPDSLGHVQTLSGAAIFNLFHFMALKLIPKILWHTKNIFFADLTKKKIRHNSDSLTATAIVLAVVLFYLTI